MSKLFSVEITVENYTVKRPRELQTSFAVDGPILIDFVHSHEF